MNLLIKNTCFLLLLTLLSIAYSFQSPTPKPKEIPENLIPLKQQAEAFVTEGSWEEANAAYSDLQKKCLDQGLELVAINLYEEILTICILREDLEFEDKLNTINQYLQASPNPYFKGLYYGALSHLYLYYAEVDSMQKYYDLAIDRYKKENRPIQAGNLNANLAHEFYLIEDIQTAKVFVEKAEKILAEDLKPNGQDLPAIYNVQTIVYVELGEYDKALKSNLISIKGLEANPELYALDLVYEYNNLATLYSYLHDYNSSIIYYQKAINIIEVSNDYSNIQLVTLLNNLAATYTQINEHDLAKKAFLRCILYLEKNQEKNQDALTDYINVCHSLFSNYRHFDNLDSAEYYLKKAEKLNEIFPYRVHVTLQDYALLFSDRKQHDKAKVYYKKALDKAIEVYGPINESVSGMYLSLSAIEIEASNSSRALFYTQKALESISLEFSDPNGYSNPTLDNVLFKKDLLNVLNRKLSILKLLTKEKDSTIPLDILYSTAKLVTLTLEQINTSIRDVESKRFWLNTKAIPLFEQAILIAINFHQSTGDSKYLNEAFTLSERSKSMLMTGAIQEANAASIGGVPDSLVEKTQRLEKEVANAEKLRFDAKMAGDKATEEKQDSAIFKARYQLDVLQHTFETEYPKYFELKYAGNSASIEQIQANIDASTTFIEYFEGANFIYVFTILKNTARVHTIKKDKDFKQTFSRFQNSILNIKAAANKPAIVYNQFIEKSYQFYQILIENSLKEQPKRLIIVPDGQLGYLPFEALISQKQTPISQNTLEVPFASLPYLVKDYAISYNYSGTLLLNQQNQQGKILNGNILALAPSYASSNYPEWRGQREIDLRKDLAELPGAASEVGLLGKSYAGNFLIGHEATEANFKKYANQHGILHLAMHGLVDTKHPEFSGLALTEDANKKEDNLLYAYEIEQMNLQAGLVVLSACETGIGKYQQGEGVVSIGRSFMYAGTPALIMTLWQLNDESGAMIIEHFYKNLNKGMEKDEAIRQAKLSYLNLNHKAETAHPFLWAAFIQVGDYSAISIQAKSSTMIYTGIGLALFLLILLVFKIRTSRNST